MRYLAQIGGREIAVEVDHRGGHRTARVEGSDRAIEWRRREGSILLDSGGRRIEAFVSREGPAGPGRGERAYSVTIGGRLYPVRLLDPLRRGAPGTALQRAGKAEVRSIMPGRVTAVLAREGQEVKAGQGVVVVEAMKMENELPAPKDGRVTAVRVKPGETVEAGALLLVIE
jgi:biotin carboxyl carrier protein